MPSWIGPWEIVLMGPSVIGGYVALVFYLLNAQTALSRCSAENRTLAPRTVWLAMIPVFGFAWVIVIAVALSRSLGSEFHAKNIRGPARPGRGVGIAAGTLFLIATLFLVLAIVAGVMGLASDSNGDSWLTGLATWLWETTGLAALVLWIIHWVSIAGASSKLVAPLWGPAQWVQYGPAPYDPASYPWAYPGPPPPYSVPGGPYAPPSGAPYPPAYPSAAGPGPHGPSPAGEFCPSCGRFVPGTAFCPHCGKERRPRQGGVPPASGGD